MLKKIDNWLNGIVMYKLVLFGLLVIGAAAIALGFIGQLAYSGWSLLVSVLIATGVCYGFNILAAKLWRAQINDESSVITGLILFLIMGPVTSWTEAGLLALTAVVAVLSKYVLAYRHKHIFNPVAIAAVIMAVTSGYAAWWWLATWKLLPLVLVVSLLIVRKTRKELLFVVTMLSGLVTAVLYAVTAGYDWRETVEIFVLAGPMIFFVGVMVTEPLCLPGRRRDQIVYGLINGVLANMPFHWGPIYTSPELALVVANVWSFAIGQKQKLYLTLEEKRLIAKDTYEFVFAMNYDWQWLAGQYLELTLPHHADQRGVRRCFTVSSAPSEGKVKLGIKFPDKPSSFKQKLLDLQVGERINGGKAEGDFVLPRDKQVPMLWLAGGIGVTPFRSMLQQILASGEEREVTLLYANRSGADVAYKDLLAQASQRPNIKVYYLLANPCEGEDCDGQMIDRETIERLAPRWRESLVYISGPSAMVTSLKQLLKRMGLSSARVKTDYFSGF